MNKAINLLVKLLVTLLCLFIAVVCIYWFNLDTKLVKALEPVMTKHYDNMKRDRRL